MPAPTASERTTAPIAAIFSQNFFFAPAGIYSADSFAAALTFSFMFLIARPKALVIK